jgi:hypothetical protein
MKLLGPFILIAFALCFVSIEANAQTSYQDNLGIFTVGTLPTCSGAVNIGKWAIVTDASTSACSGALTGGGANKCGVDCSGAAGWMYPGGTGGSGGTGTANTGAANQIAYYAAGGAVVSGETTIPNANIPWAAPGALGATTPAAATVSQLTNNCKGTVTLSGGTGSVTNASITSTGIPHCVDTTAANGISCTPGSGTMSFTNGVGSDLISWIMLSSS